MRDIVIRWLIMLILGRKLNVLVIRKIRLSSLSIIYHIINIISNIIINNIITIIINNIIIIMLNHIIIIIQYITVKAKYDT